MQANVYEQEFVSNFESAQIGKWVKWIKWLGLKIFKALQGFVESMLLPCPVEERLEEMRQKARNYVSYSYRGMM